ncbi:rhomboid family intramembrane serine protease [Crossiella sp. CA198]|uniref:rhomboid family intramembrane serine protease n=1 Tax=Crossiella sp. CA198 TaxID=3455607 RepID=UPI003F8D07C3
MTQPHTLPGCTRHPETPTGLSCIRCEKPYCYRCLTDGSVGKQCPDCLAEGKKSQRRGVNLVGNEDEHVRPIVMPVLIALNIVVFAITVVQAGSVNNLAASWVYDNGAMWNLAVAGDQWWRLITSAFLHVALWHLAVNMLSLWMLGQELEPLFGRIRFLLLYLLSAVGSAVAVFLFSEGAVGASGAIFGLLGAVVVVFIRKRQSLQPLLMVFGLNVVFGLVIGNVSWVGHAGGLVTGALVAAGLIYVPVASRKLWQTINLVAITAAVIGLAIFQYYEMPRQECDPPGARILCGPVDPN